MNISPTLLIVSFLGAVSLVFVPIRPDVAQAQTPFGGPITWIYPGCVNGIWAIVGPPRGGSYMWVPGTRSYREGPPRHTGQYLLGVAGGSVPCLVPCESGLCPIGYGQAIQFHGSSI